LESAGQNLNNSRSQPNEQIITAANVNSLAGKWVFSTVADVSATPSVAGGAIYFPDWVGTLYAVKAVDGSILWSNQISSYDDFPGAWRA
jgi:polyvinyl alcohol dehydrogenase (cytochrome)